MCNIKGKIGIDFSISGDITREDLEELQNSINNLIEGKFTEHVESLLEHKGMEMNCLEPLYLDEELSKYE